MQKQPIFRSLIALAILLGIVWSCKKEDPAPVKSTEKAISTFAFSGISPAVNASISGTTISAGVPFSVDVTTLVPTITVSTKATVSPASGSAQNFTNPVTYTVTAEDGTTQKYTVTVTKGAAPKSAEKSILTFGFNALSPAVAASISGLNITATLPSGTDATKLVPTITLSPKATVSPATGTSQNFANPVTYTVTAEDGSTQAYNVAITVTPAPVVTTKTIKSSGELPDVLEDLSDGVDYIITADISISGTRVVTIKPGVKIQFEGGSSGFTINSQSALKMIGTAAKPIILEGKVATAGSWKGIEIRAINIENQWEYVTLSHAGGSSQTAGLRVGYFGDATRVSVKNCTFSTNLGYGIWCNDGSYTGTMFRGFSNNTFTDNTKSALKIRAVEMDDLDSQSKYSNNGQKFIEVSTQSSVLADPITVKKIDVPYRVYSVIESKDKITINAGVTMEFTTSSGFKLSYSYKNASIVAVGTAADPIKFVGYISGTKGVWLGFNLQSGNIEINLKYCQIDGAGSDDFGCGADFKAAVIFGSGCNDVGRGSITNCNITNSGGYGIAYKSGDAVTIKDNTFKDNTKVDIYDFKK